MMLEMQPTFGRTSHLSIDFRQFFCASKILTGLGLYFTLARPKLPIPCGTLKTGA